MYRLMTPLSELLNAEQWPIDFFQNVDIPAWLSSTLITRHEATFSNGQFSLSMTLLIEGEAVFTIPGLYGVSIVVGIPEITIQSSEPPADTASGIEDGGPDPDFPYDDNRLPGWTEISLGFFYQDDAWTLSLYDVSFELRFDSALLQPTDGSEYVAIGMRGNLHLDQAWNLTFDGFDDFNLASCQVGNTGLVLSASGVKLDLARQSSPEEILAAGFGEQFLGIYLQSATLQLPPSLTQANGDPISLTVSDFILGSGGVSGTLSITAPISASLLGFTFELLEGSLTLQQNAIAGGALSGNLTIPFFQQAGESSQVSLTLGMDGNFNVTLEQTGGLVNLDLPQVAALQVNGLGFSVSDGVPALLLSGTLQLQVGEPALLWPTVDLQNLGIQPDGQIRLPGGWLDLQQPLALNLFGFAMEISRLGFGSLEDHRRWVSFSGGLHLIDLLPTGVSVDGFKVTWDPAGVISPQLSLDGVGLEMTIPGVLSLTGEVALTQDGGENVFQGSASLELVPLGISLDASIKIGHNSDPQFTYFYTFLDLELPIGIPLWTSGAAIYGISGLYGANVLPSATDHDWYAWYRADPAFDIQDFAQVGGRRGRSGLRRRDDTGNALRCRTRPFHQVPLCPGAAGTHDPLRRQGQPAHAPSRSEQRQQRRDLRSPGSPGCPGRIYAG